MTAPLSDERIIESWHKNSEAWTRAVRAQQIESRKLVTDRAIVDAVLGRSPGLVLDLGCGEGWLVRELARHGIRAIGVDVVPELIAKASGAGGGEFRLASYEAIAAGALEVLADVVVANFSLIGKESTEGLLRRVASLLAPGGALIVQTLHPVVAGGDAPYVNGWRSGSWAGFSDDFTDPAPWYFRTLEGWVNLIVDSGLRLCELREPVCPRTMKPASVIFVADAG
ncbi:MAG: class I SAM-dependent methyltransferase [Gemmatimonadaceae bacterium]